MESDEIRKAKRREYYHNNKEKIKEINKRYYEKHKEKMDEYNKKYRKEYYKKHKEQITQNNKEYYKNHKEYFKEHYYLRYKKMVILDELEEWLKVNDKYSQGYFKQVLDYIKILKEKYK